MLCIGPAPELIDLSVDCRLGLTLAATEPLEEGILAMSFHNEDVLLLETVIPTALLSI